jgi:hypothetical protein
MRAALATESRKDMPRPRLLLFALGLAGAVGLAVLLARGFTGPRGERRVTMDEAVKAEKEVAEALSKSEMVAPREAQVDPATGEQVTPFAGGFALSVDSRPDGARVLVNGQEVGETPLLAGVECKPGELLELRLEKRGAKPETRTTRCRKDAVVHLEFELGR